MASAVANPQYMGYKAMYRTVLEDSRRGIAKALRVFVDADSFPVLIHCIHGARVQLLFSLFSQQSNSGGAAAESSAVLEERHCILRLSYDQQRGQVNRWGCSAQGRAVVSIGALFAAGKDRTGIIVMLLLMLCGVDKEVTADRWVLAHGVYATEIWGSTGPMQVTLLGRTPEERGCALRRSLWRTM